MSKLAFRALAAILCLTGCMSGRLAPEIRIQLAADPVSLDPSLAEDGAALRVLGNTMDGLVGYDVHGKLELRLAESYSISPDGREMVFTLRGGTRWSDGIPVSAKDFVTGLRRSLAPSTASKLAHVFSPVESVSERDGQVVVRLKRKAPYLLDALAMSQAMPQRDDILRASRGTWPLAAPVTGAYRIAEYKPTRHLLLVPNPHYWRYSGSKEPDPKPLPVRILIVQDEATAKNLFEQGRLDILTRVNSFDFEAYRKKTWLRMDPFPATYFLSFNVREAPFSDRRLRRAASAAIRRDEIVAALKSGESAATGWIPRGLEGYLVEPWDAALREVWLYEDRTRPAKRPAKAVDAAFDSSSRNALVMEKVQHDLQKAGIPIRLENMDWKSYVKRLAAQAPPLYRFAWLAPFSDPIVHLQAFAGGNPNNYSGWVNKEYDKLVTEIEGMEKGPAREEKVLQAQRILLEEAVVVPLYHYVQVHAVRPEVEGFIVNPFGWIPFHHLRKRA